MAKPKYKFDENGAITFDAEASKVILKPYVPRKPKIFDLMTDTELLQYVGDTLIYDTEIFKNYFLAAFKHVKTGKIIKFETIPEKGIQFNNRKLSWILHNYTVVGFNNIKFDDIIIWLAYDSQDTLKLKACVNDLIFNGMRKQDLEKKYDFKCYPIKTIDLIEVAPLDGSLKLYMGRLHSKRIQEMPTNHEAWLTFEEMEHTADYCINDLDGTEELMLFMKERLELRRAMSEKYGENLMSKSDAQMAEIVLTKEVKQLSGYWPKSPNFPEGFTFKYNAPAYLRYANPAMQKMLETIKGIDFRIGETGRVTLPEELKTPVKIGNGIYRLGIGGLHSSEESTGYKANNSKRIIDRDVASYYPNIIVNLGLYPDNMGMYFLEAYKAIIAERLEAKKKKIFATDKGLKIFINGASGKFSDPYSKMYDPRLTIAVTLTGQLTLLMLVDIMESQGIPVISANTDGIVMMPDADQYDKMNEWIAFWEKETNFITEETEYKYYNARDVNAYFATKMNGDVKVKGPYSEVGSQSGTQLDNNPQSLICSDAIKNFLGKDIPIEETIMNCKDITRFITLRNVKGGAHKDGNYLGKVVRWYFSKDVTGTINYVMTNNKVADSDGARPCLDLPDTFPDDVDYDKYIKMTIDILYDVGYYHRQTQIKFF